jgi:5-methylcytosine-specific restriction endonuclease McrA
VKRGGNLKRTRLNPIGKRSRLRDKEWKVNRALAMERANGQCEMTGSNVGRCPKAATEVHHRLPTGRGGSHDLSNLLAVCSEGHRWIHAHPTVSYELGWLISGYEEAR